MSGTEQERVGQIVDKMRGLIGRQPFRFDAVNKTVQPADYSGDPDNPPLPMTAGDLGHAAAHGRIRR